MTARRAPAAYLRLRVGCGHQVEFEGLTVTPYTDASRCQGKGRCGARLAYSLKATGVRAPSRGIGRPVPEHKDAA